MFDNESFFPVLRKEFGRSPFIPFSDIFERMFKEVDNFDPAVIRSISKTTYPKVNVMDLEDKVLIEATVTGLSSDDINIELEDNVLRISANKKEELLDECTDWVKREIHNNSFYRSFYLNDNIDKEKISAEVKNGLLTLELPKKQKTQTKTKVKKIEVK
jgi:HSP20 family protein